MLRLLGKIIAAIAERLLKDHWLLLCEDLKGIYSKYQREQEYVPPLLLQQLLISGEDHRFFRHPGFDIIAICRAIWKRFIWGVREGASTIEQQTVRVITGRYERTLRRKISEIFLATLVTRVISKNEIPAIYLKIAYFGWHMNGFKEACKRQQYKYHSLSLNDAATLVARLKYPEPQIVPSCRIGQILRRRDHLIGLYRKHKQKNIYKPLMWEVANEIV